MTVGDHNPELAVAGTHRANYAPEHLAALRRRAAAAITICRSSDARECRSCGALR